MDTEIACYRWFTRVKVLDRSYTVLRLAPYNGERGL
jgi:hypothetical protein